MPSKKHTPKVLAPRLRGHAAPKPTVDEFLAARSRLTRVSTDFLTADLNTALTFTQIALQGDDDGVKKQRNRKAARKAYDTVHGLIDRVEVSDEDAKALRRNLERLKSELVKLGEIF
jgi:hypothetical protein